MDRYDRMMASKAALKQAESDGRVADSIDVRMALMERVRNGEITLAQAQTELKKIKRTAKKSGKVTREQAYRGE